jgi:hypothetical protein
MTAETYNARRFDRHVQKLDPNDPIIGLLKKGPDGRFTYDDSGLTVDHAYTILGVTVKDGQKAVVLRNPMGGVIFPMPLEAFTKLYMRIAIGDGGMENAGASTPAE